MTTAETTEQTFGVNRLILGDNLDVLKTLPDGYVDLVYLDPPFFSNRNYEVIWGDGGEVRSFQDRWSGGISHYIAWLKERVEQMHRVLKPSGSLFLHCDWHADAYIRVLILDKIFGERNFRNEIIWHYKRWPAKQSNFQRMHDVILFYSKQEHENMFNTEYEALSEGTMKRWGGKKSKVEFEGTTRLVTKMTDEDSTGRPADDVWDIPVLNSQSKERIGYPTQKPETLMERIIKCASNEGDIVLDPFMGGGTTLAVADKLNRRWIGIDQSPMAVKVTDIRLQSQTDLFSVLTPPYTVQLHKYDYDTLRYKDAFEFESWVIAQYGGVPQNKKGGDKGIDGKWADGAPIQVKRSDNVPRDVVDKFLTAVQRYDKILFERNKKAKKPVGHIIAFSFGKGAIGEAARLKNEENIIIKLVRVDEIVEVAAKPVISVNVGELERDAKGNRTLEFTARGESDAGVKFYSWDFEHDDERGFKASVIMDIEGRQAVSLAAGAHNIAVKAVDNDGLESIEVVRLRINGGVEREG